MTPRTQEQFQSIRESRKYQIMNAAMEVFARDGYHTASISRIAKEAKVSKGLLYNYFSSKEELLKAVLVHGIEVFKESFGQINTEQTEADGLKTFIKGGMSLMREDSHSFRLYFTVMFQPAAYEIIKEKYPQIIGDLIESIAHYFAMKGDPHPLEKAILLGALMDGFGLYYLMDPAQYDLDLYEKLIFDLFK